MGGREQKRVCVLRWGKLSRNVPRGDHDGQWTAQMQESKSETLQCILCRTLDLEGSHHAVLLPDFTEVVWGREKPVVRRNSNRRASVSTTAYSGSGTPVS